MYRISINDENVSDKIQRAQEAGKIIMTRFVGSPDPCYVVFDMITNKKCKLKLPDGKNWGKT